MEPTPIKLKKKYRIDFKCKKIKHKGDISGTSGGTRKKLSNMVEKGAEFSPKRLQQIATAKGQPWTEDYKRFWEEKETN